ncbi:hypothetical protein FZEAL_3944 [Fusarium zealandicum]|uniref:LysM domain-containing protein n=1 Tax=Fusarium zealandicum TaxID=1053134 RepID=A0A8H4UNI3_9HYPO|nr:hypothetical protein FZEAL_3944 [Fusarium zealandicum]
MNPREDLGGIATNVQLVLQSFWELSRPSTEQPGPSSHNEFLSRFNDEHTRFKMWAGNLGAHQNGSASLDHRLREASHLKEQVIYLLGDLRGSLQDARAFDHHETPSWTRAEPKYGVEDTTASSKDEPSHSGEEEFADSDDDGNDPNTGLPTLLTDASEAIDCLLRLSVAIANPTPHERVRKFGNGPSQDVSFYETHDIQHVREKFPNIDPGLAETLGRGITRRRQFFRYREAHHARLAAGLGMTTEEMETIRVEGTVASSIPEHLKTKANFDLRQEVIDEDDGSGMAMSETSYATSASCLTKQSDGRQQQSLPLRVPPIPTAASHGSFEYAMSSGTCVLIHVFFHAALNQTWILIVAGSGTFMSRSITGAHGSVLSGMKHYIKHVGHHLEQLALFSLPGIEDEEIYQEDEKHSGAESHTTGGTDSSGGSSQMHPQMRGLQETDAIQTEDTEEMDSLTKVKEERGVEATATGFVSPTGRDIIAYEDAEFKNLVTPNPSDHSDEEISSRSSQDLDQGLKQQFSSDTAQDTKTNVSSFTAITFALKPGPLRFATPATQPCGVLCVRDAETMTTRSGKILYSSFKHHPQIQQRNMTYINNDYQQGGYGQGGPRQDYQQGTNQQGYQQGDNPQSRPGLAESYYSEPHLDQQHQFAPQVQLQPGYGEHPQQGPGPYNQGYPSQHDNQAVDGPDGERGVMGALAGGAAGAFGGHKIGGKTGHSKSSTVLGAMAGAFSGHKLQDAVSDWKDEKDEKKEEEKRKEDHHHQRRDSSDDERPRHGNFAGNFTASSRDVRLDSDGDYVLHASCKRDDGSYQHSSITLDNILENDRGSFRWSGGGQSHSSASSVTVQQGDTLRGIAARFICSFEEIASHNNIQNPDMIYPGQTLQVPGGSGSTGGGGFGASARNVRLADGGQRLEAELSRDGSWGLSSIVLDERIKNYNGTLELI